MSNFEFFSKSLQNQSRAWSGTIMSVLQEIVMGVDQPIHLSARWVYQKLHLQEVEDRQLPTGFHNDGLAVLLKDNFVGNYRQEGWRKLSTNLAVSPEGLRVYNDGYSGRLISGSGLMQMPRVHPFGMPGWHLITSTDGPPKGPRTRFYVPSFGEMSNIPLFAELLENASGRWSLKIRSNGNDTRPDRAVLYIEDGNFQSVSSTLMDLEEKISPDDLSDRLPLFCWRLSNNIGAAPDVSSNPAQSLGQELSQLVFATLSAQGDHDLKTLLQNTSFQAVESSLQTSLSGYFLEHFKAGKYEKNK